MDIALARTVPVMNSEQKIDRFVTHKPSANSVKQ